MEQPYIVEKYFRLTSPGESIYELDRWAEVEKL